jgi:glycerol uptake facilitator-like aquaporin
MPNLLRRFVCEGLGTTFLIAAVVGSVIMAQKLSGGNAALVLLCNTLPTGAILTVLILAFGPLSGAHFNPAIREHAFECHFSTGVGIVARYWRGDGSQIQYPARVG